MLLKLFFSIIVFFSSCNGIERKETVFVVNGKKIVNSVSAEFLSFTFDLNSLFNGINNNGSNVYVENLNPAFVRVVDLNHQLSSSLNSSLSKWKLIQEWFKKSQYLPIFTINNDAASRKLWDPKVLLPFFKVNEEMGCSCYWQLLYDCGYKSPILYKEDLMMLKQVLNSSSKIVADDLSSCGNIDSNVLANYVKDLESIVDAYMWNSGYTLRVPTQISAWMELPKTKRVGFQSALQWAKQLGETAKKMYNTVFWHGHFNDVFDDTPVFWVSYFYKRLIAESVLDVTSNALTKQEIDVTAFCAKAHSKRSSMIISLVNNAKEIFTASIKLAGSHHNSVNIQQYIITFKNDGFTYLNGNKLSRYLLGSNLIDPVLENIETDDFLRLTVPAQGIGLFVLHDIEVPACSRNAQQIREATLVTVPQLDHLQKVNFNEFKNKLDDLNRAQIEEEIVESLAVSDDFYRFLGNKVKKPEKIDKTPTHIELQLTNDEILLDSAKTRNRRNIKIDVSKKKIKNQDLIADFAPVKKHERNADDSLEEEVLKSGERYVNERVEFLKEPDVDFTLEEDGGNYFFEKIEDKSKFQNARIKRQSGVQINADSKLLPELENIKRWQNIFNDPKPNRRKRLNSEIVRKRNKNNDMKLLKDKIENRKKMSNWIRNRQKKNSARQKRSLLHGNKVYIHKVRDDKSITHYLPKVLKDKWKPDDLRLIRKKPSYSIENLNQREFLPTLKRKQRKPRNVPVDLHLTENSIRDNIINKIPKNKFYNDGSTSTTVSEVGYTMTPTISSYKNEDKSNFTKNETNFVSKNLVRSEQVLDGIVDTVKDFIENVYQQIANFFME